jgi:anti-sigma B factor antagonist
VISRRTIKIADRVIEPSDTGERPGWNTTRMSGLVWLQVGFSTQADQAIVTLAGELDIASTGIVGRRLSALIDEGFTRIVIDLSELVFCDATGLGILIKTAVRAAQRGGWLRVTTAGPMIDRIIGITGLRRVLPSYGTVEDALAGRTAVPHSVTDG